MIFVEDGPFANPAIAAEKLLAIATSLEPDRDKRYCAGRVNEAFVKAGGKPNEYRAGLALLISRKAIEMHKSGAFFKLPVA